MEIKIKTLRLRNFKGTRDAEYSFEGQNARIEGRNGSGKSTVFDAFTWLLFGKDHRGQTENSFEIKTIDPATGKPFPRLDHWVEAVLLVDGSEVTLRRAWSENWVKPTGKIDDVMRGHTTTFFINGQDAGTKKAFDAFVAQWMNEDVFKLITNPLYFIDDRYTDWKTRRKAILSLVQDDPGRLAVREQFRDVVDALSGRSIEDYRKRVQLEKRANKADLDNTLARIAGMKESLPEEVDEAAVKASVEAIRAERDAATAKAKKAIEDIDAQLADAEKANAARKDEVSKLWDQITKIQVWKNEFVSMKQAQARQDLTDFDSRRYKADVDVNQAHSDLLAAERILDRKTEDLDDLNRERGEASTELNALGVRYKAEKEKAFSFTAETRCHACGQELPAATVEEARAKAQAAFLADQKDTIDDILSKAKKLKEDIAKIDAAITARSKEVAMADAALKAAQQKLSKLKEDRAAMDNAPLPNLEAIAAEARKDAEYVAKENEERELTSRSREITAGGTPTNDLLLKRRAAEEEVRRISESFAQKETEAARSLAVSGERERQLALITQKQNEARAFADAIARDERIEARLLEYIKADIDSVEHAINSLFKVARWKMFDQTIEGGLVEMCEVTSPDGVPYRSMNDAMKTLCGMDVIRVFSDRYDAKAPIFVDNAEGVLATSFGTSAQVIRLVVKDCDITTVKEA